MITERRRQPDATCRRILEAAGQLFARRGFDGVGFREIAARAKVSLRMPNHHFGSKADLFGECVRYALIEKLDFPGLFQDSPCLGGKKEARAAVEAHIRACFFAIHPPSGSRAWYGEILARNLYEQKPEAVAAMQEGFRPAREWFYAAVRVIDPTMTSDDYLFWYISLWAQVSFYFTARREILARLGKRRYDAAFLKCAADHLVDTMLLQLERR
jgi:AcrR family transcriptional regulator